MPRLVLHPGAASRLPTDGGGPAAPAATWAALTMLQGEALVALDDEVRALAHGRVPFRPDDALAAVHG